MYVIPLYGNRRSWIFTIIPIPVDCAYGEIHDEKDHHMPKAGEWHKQFEKGPSYDKKPLPNRTGEEKKNSSLAKAVVIIIAIITIINALTSLFASLF